MKEFTYIIKDPNGIHARPAGMLVKEASLYQAEILLEKEGKQADAKRIFSIMGLGIQQGQAVTVRITGKDEEAAQEAMQRFMEENL